MSRGTRVCIASLLTAAGLVVIASRLSQPPVGRIAEPARPAVGPNRILFFRGDTLTAVNPDGTGMAAVGRVPLVQGLYRAVFAVSPDATRYAVRVWAGEPNHSPYPLRVARTDGTGSPVEFAGGVFDLTWSPDGRAILGSSYTTVHTGDPLDDHGLDASRIEPFSYPRFAWVHKARLMDPATGRGAWLDWPPEYTPVRWTGPNTVLVSRRRQPGAWKRTVRSRSGALTDAPAYFVLSEVRINPDSGGCSVSEPREFFQLGLGGTEPRVSPDRTRLLTLTSEGSQAARQLILHQAVRHARGFELFVLFGDKDRPPVPAPVALTDPHRQHVHAACWSPDGSKVAYLWREPRPITRANEIGSAPLMLTVANPDGSAPTTFVADDRLHVHNIRAGALWISWQ